MQNFDQQVVNQFKAAVLAHITDKLPVSEWERFRAIAADPERARVRGLPPVPNATPAELVDAAVSQDGVTLDVALPRAFNSMVSVAASGDGWTIYYVTGEGIYVWAPYEEREQVMSVWLTHPAYPPSW